MQKTNVSHGKTKMDKMVRRRELPCFRCSSAYYRGRVVRSAIPIVDGKKKSDKEAMKRQRRGLKEKKILCYLLPTNITSI
jgi:hypothetical protein